MYKLGYHRHSSGCETESVVPVLQCLLIVDLTQERKKRIVQLEQQISAAKKLYAETLQNLERISDDIHLQRHQERQRDKKARKLAKSADKASVIYHPLMDEVSSSSDDDSGNETSGDVDSTELTVPPLVGVVAVKDVTVRQIDCIPVPNSSDRLPVASSDIVNSVKPPTEGDASQLNLQHPETSSEKSCTEADVETGDSASTVRPYRSSSLAESSSPVSPECDVEQIQANAAVMAAISRSKLQRVVSPFLRPDSCREDFSANGGSETESVSGSFVSGGVGALDDDQIESLMVDVTEYQRIAADIDTDRYQQMALPARLRHLQDFVKFEPIWIEDDANDAGVDGAGAECHGAKTEVTDDHVFTDTENVESSNSESHSTRLQSTDVTLDKKECLLTGEANSPWHPLMDNVSSTTVSESNGGHE